MEHGIPKSGGLPRRRRRWWDGRPPEWCPTCDNIELNHFESIIGLYRCPQCGIVMLKDEERGLVPVSETENRG